MKPRLLLIIPIVPIAIGIASTLALLTGCKDSDPRPAPAIISFSPKSGPEGSTVTITGTNFSDVKTENEVRFNGVKSTVTASTATSITTTVPVGATSGVITIKVGGQSGLSDTPFTLNPLIGTWRLTSVSYTNCIDPLNNSASSCTDNCPILTVTGNTFSYTFEGETFDFTYSLSGSTLTILYPGGNWKPTYVLAGGQLTLVYPPDECSVTETYVKQ